MWGEPKMNFTIDGFWKKRLLVSNRGQSGLVAGWKHIKTGLQTFLQAPLTLGEGFGDADPAESNVILVSAPGAVGKSTLAREIAHKTGAMLLDLAQAEPVGANTVVGGLAITGLYEPYLQGQASLIIDGLDEARMRVTEDSFAAFMSDIVRLIGSNRKPVVLFGRTAAVEEAWFSLSFRGLDVPILQIGFYDTEEAAEFARIQTQYLRSEPDRREPDGRAIDLLLGQIRAQIPGDGDSFAGYSPVLIAVAKQVAGPDNGDSSNTQKLISRIQRGEEKITLSGIAESILRREQVKLSTLQLEDQTLRDKLYTPKEQLARLVSHLYDTNQSFLLPPMSVADQETYNNVLKNWVSEHPFLDGEGQKPSSAVFGGLIASEAIQSEDSTETALSRELSSGTAINPFLAEFYIAHLDMESERQTNIPAEHVGILYASLRARLMLGQIANLRIDGEIDAADDEEGIEIEITRSILDSEVTSTLTFVSEFDGHFRFGPRIEDVNISAPHARVSVGYGSEVVFVAPVSIDVNEIALNVGRVVAEISPIRKNLGIDLGQVVHLRAKKLSAPHVSFRPVCRDGVTLELSWPGSAAYPWSDFATAERNELDGQMDEAVRRLKKILRLFASRGKGRLAKYRKAIDHRRRTKGLGKYVRDQLLDESVLTIEGQFYYLDPVRLAEVVGLRFHDVLTSHTTSLTIEFLKRAIDRNG